MELVEAIRGRISVRAYKADPVPRETIERLLEVARWAPSGSNSQPWRVTVVAGEALEAWRAMLIARAEASRWDAARQEAFDRRVRSGSLGALAALSERSPYELLVLGSNRLYDAPAAVVLSFSGEEGARTPDGIPAFVTTLMLAAHEMGLGACWLGFVMGQPDLVREHARIPADEQPAAVLALGYLDPDAPENRFRSPREPVGAFTRWVE
jgi:nitroreductase